MSTNENTLLILQYMRLVLRQQDTLINTISSIQRQNDNLYSLITDLLQQQRETPPQETTTHRRRQPTRTMRNSSTRPVSYTHLTLPTNPYV